MKAKDRKKKNEIKEYGKEFEGDIRVLCNQIRENYGMEEVRALVHEKKLHRSCLDDGKRDLSLLDRDYYWDNRRGDDGVAIIPYKFDKSFDSAFSQNIVTSGLNDLAKKSGVIRFVKRTTEKPYISVIDGDGCWSYVGRIVTEKQEISLSTRGCVSEGIAQHEFLHALGFWHEQSRPDRDDYVKVVEKNIIESAKINFNKQTGANSRGSPYDYASIMHYPKSAFSRMVKTQSLRRTGRASAREVRLPNPILFNCAYSTNAKAVRGRSRNTTKVRARMIANAGREQGAAVRMTEHVREIWFARTTSALQAVHRQWRQLQLQGHPALP